MRWGPLGSELPLVYDLDDCFLVETSRWCLTNGYPSRRRNGRIEYLHVLIAGQVDGMEVDHRNGNHLDVRRTNLRHVPHRSNAQNLRISIKNTSGYRGVSFDKVRGNWRASATIAGRRHELGRFTTAEAAAEAAKTYRLTHMEGALG